MSPENLNRARFLAIRQNAENIVALLRETDVQAMREMAAQALQAGPVRAPAFWPAGARSHEELQAAVTLADLLAQMKAALPPR